MYFCGMKPVNNKFYIETFGCQMNFSDSEIVASVLKDNSFSVVSKPEEADILFLNTCSIRDNAEERVLKRIREYKHLKKKNPEIIIGILGCMAERMKETLFSKEPVIDLLAGPDAYRELPHLISSARHSGLKTANTLLSADETYADINPVRLQSNGVSAFISIMRGCENFCSYCVVPYTRGKERSRNPQSIISECRELFNNNFREVCLLGQNVNSYYYEDEGEKTDFPGLIQQIAEISPLLRIRFATSHPKDLSDRLIETIAAYSNICRAIHLPVQSGSNHVLKRMNRKYTREWYIDRITKIKSTIPDCAISTDIICGFSRESDEDHMLTLDLMKEVGFDYAFMFKYSEREGTMAAKKLTDDIPENVKSKRLQEVIALQQHLSHQSNKKDIGKCFEVLIEGYSKKSTEKLMGRNSQNKVVVFSAKNYKPGDYATVSITSCTSATLRGELVDSFNPSA